jgi:hypothetical protein
MPRHHGTPSIFTWTYLDLIVTLFAVMLCLFVLVALDSHLRTAARAGRFVVLAVEFVGKGADGKSDPGIALRGRLELVAPPPSPDREAAGSPVEPAIRPAYLLPRDRFAARQVVDNLSADARGSFAYCVLRGVKPDQVLLRVSLYAVAGQERLREVEIRGWIADPRFGKRPIAQALRPDLSVGPIPSTGPSPRLVTPDLETLYKSILVFQADMEVPKEPASKRRP